MSTAKPGIEDGKSAEYVKDLLLEDYRYRADSLWKNEQSGETRLNFYIGFVTVVIGALVALAKDSPPALLPPVALVSLGMLLAFGFITFMRMLTRNEHTDLCKRGLDTIRQAFKDHFDPAGMLVGYYPVAQPELGKAKESKHLMRKVGGLSYTVAVINSALLGVMIAIASLPSSGELPQHIYGSAAISALAAFAAQVTYVKFREKQSEKQLLRGTPTHAGGVVFRAVDGTVEYLIQQRKDDPHEWLLPKGHIEKGEGHGETALREVREETGVVGRLRTFIIRTNFNASSGKVDAKFYLIECIYQARSHETNREIEWHPFEAAVAKLSFEESQIVLRAAECCRRALDGVRAA